MPVNRWPGRALFFLAFWLVACQDAPPAQLSSRSPPAGTLPVTVAVVREATVSPVATSALAPVATATIVPWVTETPLPTSTATSTRRPTPRPSLTPSATADLYTDLTIGALAARSYGGGLLTIKERLEQNDNFSRYLINYPSDGLTIYGFMNVPNEGAKFPVAIMLHGYIDPSQYETVAYTRRYADALAKAGYFVIHPNLRNYPPSDSGPDPYRVGMAIDVLNLIAIVREQSQDITGTLRRADAEDINLWGHSMGGGVALRVITVNNEAYIRAAVLYGSMSGDEVLNYERIRQWSGGRRGHFELAASAEMMAAISPITHLDRIRATISIHHSLADDVVPVEWSINLCEQLQVLSRSAECFTYPRQSHTFHGPGDALFIERFIAFFDQY